MTNSGVKKPTNAIWAKMRKKITMTCLRWSCHHSDNQFHFVFTKPLASPIYMCVYIYNALLNLISKDFTWKAQE